MSLKLQSGTSTNLLVVETDGSVRTTTRGAQIASTSVTVNAAATGVLGPVDVSTAGNVSIIVKNTVPGTPWTGSPVIVFEQSDDAVSWTPLWTVRSDTQQALATHVLGAGAANTSIVFDAALEGVDYVRARVTTGTTTGGLTLVAQPGGLPFTPSVALATPARTPVLLYGTALAVGLTGVETLLTLSQQKGFAATVNASSYTIAAGKKLRVQSLVFTQVGNSTATAAQSTFRWRYNPAGAATVTSTPILLPVRAAAPASALSYTQPDLQFGDGLELTGDGVGSFAFTVTSTYTTNPPTVDVTLVGYEY